MSPNSWVQAVEAVTPASAPDHRLLLIGLPAMPACPAHPIGLTAAERARLKKVAYDQRRLLADLQLFVGDSLQPYDELRSVEKGPQAACEEMNAALVVREDDVGRDDCDKEGGVCPGVGDRAARITLPPLVI
ncbi:hypothetical protein ABZV14_03520 [Streptosporangium canum]|uniref:hypothetical protein n=1 Tax=Streptosporangium canum TaxID=324952 RepID=UPI0033B3899C